MHQHEILWWFLRNWMLVRRFVRPLYLELLHGNFTNLNDTNALQFRQSLTKLARSITDSQINRLLSAPEWRCRLTGAWFVGLTRRVCFVPAIGTMLLASERAYAGQGYCVALALVGNDECADFLRRYLETYLPRKGRYYDQIWAIGALSQLKDSRLQQYLREELWLDGSSIVSPAKGIERFNEVISYLRRYRLIQS